MSKNRLWKNLAAAGVVPLTLATMAFIWTQERGPLWQSPWQDPAYIYCIAALELANFHSPHHTDHPGVPLTSLGALMFRGVSWFRNPPDFVMDVLTYPEVYLSSLNGAIIVLSVLALFFLGMMAGRITGSHSALVVQLLPFATAPLWIFKLCDVSPEGALFAVSFCMIALILYRYADTDSKNVGERAAFWFALITATGSAIKIVFLPFGLIPLILLPGKRLKFILTTAAMILVLLLPVVNQLGEILSRYGQLMIHAGVYATGEPTVIQPKILSANLKQIFLLDPVVIGLPLMSLAFGAVALARLKPLPKEIKIIMAVSLGILLNVMMAMKHYNRRYLLPSQLLVSVIPYMAYLYARTKVSEDRRGFSRLMMSWIGAASLAVLLASLIGFRLNKDFAGLKEIRSKIERVLHAAECPENDPGVKVYWYRSSAKVQALALGNGFANRRYSGELKALYPGVFFIQIGQGQFKDWGQEVSWKDITTAAGCGEIVFQGTPIQNKKVTGKLFLPPVSLQIYHQGDLESVYRTKNSACSQ